MAEYSTLTPQTTPVTRYLTSDHLGSPRIITGSNGAVLSRRDFMPFGEEAFIGVGNRAVGHGYTYGDSTRQKFTSYERDNETDLDYAKARMFDYGHGRFSSPDAVIINLDRILSPHLLNLYIYAGNNPLKYIDPSGLWEWSAALGGSRTDDEINSEIDGIYNDKSLEWSEREAKASSLITILQDRANIRAGFETAQKIIDALKTNYGATATALQSVKDQYGAEHDGNDVVIGVRDSKSTSGVAFTKIQGGKRIVAISISEINNSNTLFATLIHEGTHLQQASNYQSSGNNPALWQAEYQAYSYSNVIAIAGQLASQKPPGSSPSTATYSAGGTQIGQGNWTAQQSDTAIKQHLFNLGLMQVNNQNQYVASPRGSAGAFPGGGVWH